MTVDFRFYFSLFLRRLHYFLIMLALGSAAGLTLATVLPPVYRAEAVLIVESQQIPSELAESTVQTNTGEQLQIIQQRILTRARLIDMARELGVYDALGDQPARRLPADELVEDMRRRISINTVGGRDLATIVRVSFTAPTASMSASVTNVIVTQLLDENVQIRTNVAGQTLRYFTDEVERLDQEIADRGAQILAFQMQNLDSLPDSLDFRRRQQASAQERLLQLSREAATLTDRRESLVALYEATGRIGPVAPESLSPEERRLQALQDERASLLFTLSPQNPRVRLIDGQIAALEQAIAAQGAAAPIDPQGEVLSPFDIQLADIDAQLDFVQSQQEQISSQMEELRLSIEQTPSNAITLDTLQRDYSALRIQYDRAVANRARAETGDTIEALAKGQRITVIEQAVPPREPVSPNRRLIAVAGIGGGFAAGLGLVALIELLGSAIRRPTDISRKLGITPLGTIPMIRTPWEVVKRRATITCAFLIVLVALPVGLWFVHTQITPLDRVLQQALSRLGVS